MLYTIRSWRIVKPCRQLTRRFHVTVDRLEEWGRGGIVGIEALRHRGLKASTNLGRDTPPTPAGENFKSHNPKHEGRDFCQLDILSQLLDLEL